MKVVILYDSAFGNTAKVAKAMASAAKTKHNICKTVILSDIQHDDIATADLLVVGSPTQGGQPTQGLKDFLNNVSPDVLKNKPVAVFDTRFAINEHGVSLKLVMMTIGFAAPKIKHILQAKGANCVADPEGFIVRDKEGPLLNGEIERASKWMRDIIISFQDEQQL